MSRVMHIPYSEDEGISVFNVGEYNSSFAVGSLKTMYLGNNRNKSSFTKEDVMAALPSLRNVPIVAHYDAESNTIGGHDVEVVADANGDLNLRTLTTPLGVVPESATFKFTKDEDDNGVEHEYLVINNVLLWKRQKDVYNHIVEDLGGKVGHSMEITVNSGVLDKDTGIFAIHDFEFTALCLLETATPCFEGSELELFSNNDTGTFKSLMAEMMSELKQNDIDTPEKEFDMAETDNTVSCTSSEKGGQNDMEEKINLIAEYNLNVEDLNFSIEEISVDELREKLEQFNNNPEPEGTAAPDANPEQLETNDNLEDIAEENFELNSNVRDLLGESLRDIESIERSWGSEPRYWMVDYDTDQYLVYAYDSTDCYLCGFRYEFNGDMINILTDTKKRMKWAIVEFDGGAQPLPFGNMYQTADELFSVNQQKLDETTQALNQMKAEFDRITEQLNELKNYKAEIERAESEAQRDEVLNNFDDLEGNEMFEELKLNKNEYSIEALEEKCFAIRGRSGSFAKFSADNKSPRILITPVTSVGKENDAPYGGIVEKYTHNKI